jgi:hypothetical protein
MINITGTIGVNIKIVMGDTKATKPTEPMRGNIMWIVLDILTININAPRLATRDRPTDSSAMTRAKTTTSELEINISTGLP